MPERKAAHKHPFSGVTNKTFLWLLLQPNVRTQQESKVTEKSIRTVNVVKSA